MPLIIEDLLPSSYVDELETVMTGIDFPWFYQSYGTVYTKENIDIKTIDVPQFVHSFYKEEMISSPFYPLVFPLLVLLEKHTGKTYRNRILRIKANLITKDALFPENCYHPVHIDDSNSNETLLYYVNTSDGDTFLFNEGENQYPLTLNQRISPSRGRVVLFDSSKLHASSSPRISSSRVVINIVFKKED
jgi:hypothetical protein